PEVIYLTVRQFSEPILEAPWNGQLDFRAWLQHRDAQEFRCGSLSSPCLPVLPGLRSIRFVPVCNPSEYSPTRSRKKNPVRKDPTRHAARSISWYLGKHNPRHRPCRSSTWLMAAVESISSTSRRIQPRSATSKIFRAQWKKSKR